MFNREKAIGAYLGAAIGDAMGGPVECLHFETIRSFFPEGVSTLVPYVPPYALMELRAGYALHSDAGSVTDDTFIRKDFTKYFMEVQPPYTAHNLACWLAENATFDQWWPLVTEILFEIKAGKADATQSGMTHMQGGGIGWWTPVGILWAGQPKKAAAVARELCSIWKSPLEQDFCGAFAASVAVAVADGSTYQDVVNAMLDYGGPLTRKLLERAIKIGEEATSLWDLARKLYDHVLIHSEPTRLSDGPMPEEIAGTLEPTGEEYTSFYWAEQMPLAIASLVYGKGSMDCIGYCVSLGRDCDTTATTVGAWVGGLQGQSGIPSDWIEKITYANRQELNLVELAEELVDFAEKL